MNASASFAKAAFDGKPYSPPTDWHSYHALYEDATPEFKAAIDAAYEAVNQTLKSEGIKLAYGDQAERFIAAIVRYIHESFETQQ